MPKVLACVDGSAYAQAVCDYSALFADRTELDVVVLSVCEGSWMTEAASAAARAAADRLHDQGFERFTTEVVEGPFVASVARAADDAVLVVMGKRGIDRGPTLSHLGSHVEPILRTLTLPTCLVSQLYLPVSHALVILDSDPSHKRAMEFATSSPLMRDFELDLLLMDDGRHGPETKLATARRQLSGLRGSAFALPAENPNEAMDGGAGGRDILVLSREMLFGPAGADFKPGDETSFWRRRTPLLVC